MHIVNIIQCTNLGGMEQASLRLMKGLKERGHTCEYVSLNPIGPLGELLEDAGIPCTGLSYASGKLRTIFQLRKVLQQSHADALIMTGQNLAALLALPGVTKGRRLLSIHYHHEGYKSKRFWKVFYSLARFSFDAVSFPSDFVRGEAIAIDAPLAKIASTVRYPARPVPALLPSEKESAKLQYGIPIASPVVGNAGWLIDRKRFDVFLDVAGVVSRQNRDVYFVIAGDGPLRPELEQLVRTKGLQDRVKWIGWQKDMRQFYAAIDILLFNSDFDALPVTPQEAMLHGIPVVASVVRGGLNEIVSAPAEGVLLGSHDVDALAKATLHLLDKPEELRRVGKEGQRRILALSDHEEIVDWHMNALKLDR